MEARRPAFDKRRIPIVGGPADRRGAGAKLKEQVTTSNRWSPLLELESTDIGGIDPTDKQEVCDAAADRWTEACYEVAAETGIYDATGGRRAEKDPSPSEGYSRGHRQEGQTPCGGEEAQIGHAIMRPDVGNTRGGNDSDEKAS